MSSRSRLTITALLATAATTATTGLVASGATAGTDAGDGDGGFSVAAALAELPPVPGDSGYWITVGDIGAATALAGIERPDSLELEALAPWFMQLTGMSRPDSDPPEFAPIFLPLPEVLAPHYAVMIEETAETVGWSVVDVSWYAAIESPPSGSFAVLHGDFADTALAELPLVESTDDGDVVTLIEGDDLQMSMTERNALSAIGVPIRMARVDDAIALSRTTQSVATWLGGWPSTAADNPALSTIATALDEAGVHSATIGTTMLLNPMGLVSADADVQSIEELLDELAPMLLPAGATHVGIGWGADDDGAAVITLAYFVIGGPEAIDAAASAVEVGLADGVSQRGGRPLTELLTLDSVTTGDAVVVATVRPAEGRPPTDAYNMWLSADFPFVVG